MPLGWMFQPFQRQKPGQDSSRWRPHQAHWPADAFSLLNFKVLEFAPDAPTTGKDWNEALCKPQPEQAAIRAGYSAKRADAIGYDLLRKPEIQAEIQRGKGGQTVIKCYGSSRNCAELLRGKLHKTTDSN